MKLPFSFGKKEIKNHFLALLLQDEKIGAVVFEETAGRMHVVSRAEQHFSSSLEESEFDEWLDVVDKAISTAEETLSNGIQTEKTVFGVKQKWIEDGKIKKEYLAKLKRVCDELELQPIGFLVFTEAIIHLLQQEEGAPISAILVEIGRKFIDISIIRGGRTVTTQQIPFTSPVPQAIDTALKHFSDVEIFPSRIILFDSEHNEQRSQSFITHSWSKSLPFLHMPQITILPPGFETKGVLVGTATQMGFAVAQSDLRPIPIRTHSPQENKAFEKEKSLYEDLETKEETALHEEKEIKEPEETPKEEKKEVKYAIEEAEETNMETAVNADYFGFIKNKDIINSPHAIKEDLKQVVPSDVVGQAIEEIPEEVKDEETEFNSPKTFPVNSMLLFEGIKKGLAKISFPKLFQRRRKTPLHTAHPIREPGQAKPFNTLFIIAPAILLLFIGTLVWYVTSLGAIVTVTITPKALEEKQTVKFDVGGSNDFGKNTIAAKEAQTQEQGTLSANATGTKQVGTPAKGTIALFSTLTSSSSIPKGTTVTSSNNLTFTLDNSVSVASSSGNAGDFVTVNNINVTAKNIGTDSNLPSGTKFTINGFSKSDMSAKNDAPFSGGTQKNVTVVAQKDVDTLLDNLTKNLSDKAKNDMNTKQSGDEVILPFFTKQEVTKKTFSKNVGDETKTVSLDATITYHGASYSKTDIASFAQSVFKDKIPSGNELSKNGIQSTVEEVKQDNSASLDIKASLVPKLDTQALIKDISGKSFAAAESLLKTNSQITNVTINLKPNLPFLPKLLPRFSKNIQIVTNNE